ncbi:hypothetical protein [Hymenobacter psychrotolerans]|uniref:Uncharacterized protein n=1 Tax=Hymenobacter psychrotolerans DSM 18569 TaxID=1121959 RepID=A0A1M6TLK3_9BACT|nr:hypothetical protein [Hymenobacter psychrotolerans]SHK57847.1 hypothetical protein SAMN02746009_01157 [Hymenobacter psychrotolerans DSM 18569]
MLLQCFLTFVVLLICGGAVAALATVITWQEQAPSAAIRRQRLLGVVPISSFLLLILLGAIFSVMLLWSGRGADLLATL